MMEMGIGMGGIEDRILDVTRNVASSFDAITYIEIGVGEGATLTAIASELKTSGKKWRAIGIELPNGYSFSKEKTENWAAQRNLKLNFVTPNSSIVHPEWGAVTVYFKDSQTLLTEHWQGPIQFALIDGCHGRPCATLDFLALEAFMMDQPGATVMFHDFGEDQRGHWQPHCPTGLDVHGACYDLGLLTGRRAKWRMADIFVADRTIGSWDMGVFERLE
jgi:hypothetical protein